MTSPRRLRQHIGEDRVHQQCQQHAGRDAHGTDRDALAGPQEQTVGTPEILLRDRLSLAVDQPQRVEDVERAERDDERWESDLGDQPTVEGTEQHPDGCANQQGQHRRHPVVEKHLGHHEVSEQHRRPHRQIDACGEDDQCLTDRKRGKHCGLLQDDADRLRALEAPLTEDREHHARDQQDEGGAEYRVPVQRVLDPVEEPGRAPQERRAISGLVRSRWRRIDDRHVFPPELLLSAAITWDRDRSAR